MRGLLRTVLKQLTEEVNRAGFSRDLDVYHGTSRSFLTFRDDAKRHDNTPDDEVQGHFFTSNIHSATSYASRAQKKEGGKARVIKANLHFDNPIDVTKTVKKYQRKGMAFGEAKRKAYDEVDRKKHDGILFHGDTYNSSEYIALDASKIKIKDHT